MVTRAPSAIVPRPRTMLSDREHTRERVENMMSVAPTNLPSEYREWIDSIDWEQARAEHEQFSRDVEHLNALRPRLREEHPDCYVIVFEKKIVAVGPVRKEVLADLDRLGIPRRLAAMKFISKEPTRLIV